MCIWHSSQELVYLRPSIHIEACSQNSEKQLLASSRLSVWPSTCMEQHSYQHKFSRNFIIWRHMYIYDNILLSSSDSEKFFKQKLLRKSKHTFYVQQLYFFFFFSVYEIMWKNVVQRGRPQMTIRRMRVACWIPKSRTTLPLCNTYCFPTETIVTRTHLNVTLDINCLFCYILSSGLQKLVEKSRMADSKGSFVTVPRAQTVYAVWSHYLLFPLLLLLLLFLL
jgi:hypothetical protein